MNYKTVIGPHLPLADVHISTVVYDLLVQDRDDMACLLSRIITTDRLPESSPKPLSSTFHNVSGLLNNWCLVSTSFRYLNQRSKT